VRNGRRRQKGERWREENEGGGTEERTDWREGMRKGGREKGRIMRVREKGRKAGERRRIGEGWIRETVVSRHRAWTRHYPNETTGYKGRNVRGGKT